MTISLQEELAERIRRNPRFSNDIKNLLQNRFIKFSENEGDTESIKEQTYVGRLAEASLIMASSGDERHRILAYELATVLFEEMVTDFPGLNGFMKLICARLGNTPAIGLLNEKLTSLPDSLFVESEIAIFVSEQSIGDESLHLTDFQMRSYELLEKGFSVSLSAPTSAGKSFLVTQFVTDVFLKNKKRTIVVIVPTRALIRQFTMDFLDTFKEHSLRVDQLNIEIITSSVEKTGRPPAPKRLFVLTQERLQSVLYNWQPAPHFDLLIVDESQKVEDMQRGIILEDTIVEMASRYRGIQCIFLSPLSSNPEILLKLAGIALDSEYLYSSFSPVAQHLYSVTTKKGDRRSLIIEKLNSRIEDFKVTLDLTSSLSSTKTKKIVFLATLLGRDASNIIYATGPSRAETIALELAKNDRLTSVNSIPVLETMEYLAEVIHEEYHLIDCLEKGVGYHYGYMPNVARISVEDLFRDGLINFVVCTSTLLEGVNLPAKNIFIDTPKLGNTLMDDGSFWNLVGRAGRLMQDFSGNIYCIDPETWDKPVSEMRRNYEIKSSLNQVMRSEEFLRYSTKLTPEINLESCEQALNTLVIKYKEHGREFTEAFIEQRVEDQSRAESILTNAANLAESTQLPLEVLKKNKAIDIRLQERFALWLSQRDRHYLEQIIPRQPFFSGNLYELIRDIFEICDQFFTLSDRGSRYRYYAVIATQWVQEKFLRDMIIKTINYQESEDQKNDVNKIIRDLVRSLNNEVRFHYVRSTKCYCDLMQFELERRSIEAELPSYTDFRLPNYLELGLSNEGAMNFHSMGLSRITSIELNRFCREAGVPVDEMVPWVSERAVQVAERMPRPLRSEVLRVFLD
jgi:superfamily II DNA/RNA helicase